LNGISQQKYEDAKTQLDNLGLLDNLCFLQSNISRLIPPTGHWSKNQIFSFITSNEKVINVDFYINFLRSPAKNNSITRTIFSDSFPIIFDDEKEEDDKSFLDNNYYEMCDAVNVFVDSFWTNMNSRILKFENAQNVFNRVYSSPVAALKITQNNKTKCISDITDIKLSTPFFGPRIPAIYKGHDSTRTVLFRTKTHIGIKWVYGEKIVSLYEYREEPLDENFSVFHPLETIDSGDFLYSNLRYILSGEITDKVKAVDTYAGSGKTSGLVEKICAEQEYNVVATAITNDAVWNIAKKLYKKGIIPDVAFSKQSGFNQFKSTEKVTHPNIILRTIGLIKNNSISFNKMIKTDLVLIDEASKLVANDLNHFNSFSSEETMFILYGDTYQSIIYSDLEEPPVSIYKHMPRHLILEQSHSYRCPTDVTEYVSHAIYRRPLITYSKVKKSVTIKINECNPHLGSKVQQRVDGTESRYNENFYQTFDKEIPIITYYRAQAEFLKSKGFEAYTIDAVQGLEFENLQLDMVLCGIEKPSKFMYLPERINVALTRHKKTLIIYTCSETVNDFNFLQYFIKN
jgi:hypothetical protein